MDEENDINLKKINIISGYVFLGSNICIIFVLIFLIRSRKKNIRMLKYKLFALMILDSMLFFIYENIIKNLTYIFNPIVGDILFACLSSIEFYLFISFIYQIFNCTEISKLAKKIVLIDPLLLTFLFLFVTFSYHKYLNLFPEIIKIVEHIIILCCITLLYRYLRDKTKIIKNNLLPKDINSAIAFNSLKKLNSIGFLFIVCYYALKIITKYMPKIFFIMIYIILNGINFLFKYFIFFSFAIMIYQLNEKRIEIKTDETYKIIYTPKLN